MGGDVPIARRNMLADRRRLATSVLGVAAAVALILLLQGLWSGFRTQISAYEDNVGVDLFVGERGTRNFFGVPSVLPLDAVPTIRAIPGVDRADPIVARFAVLDLHGRNQFTFLIGSVPGDLGGPWDVVEGGPVRTDDEIVVDETLADQHAIGLGDRLEIMGKPFRVVGLSAGTRSWMASFVFMSHEAVEALVRMPRTTGFVLVRTRELGSVTAAIRQRTGLAVLTPQQLGDNDRELLGRVMNGPLSLMVVIAFAAGTLIIALTVYSAIVDRIREYGIAKAMGARRGRLFRIVLGQTFIVAALGTVVGNLMFLGGFWLIVRIRPQMWVQGSAAATGEAVLAAALMAVAAAVFPTGRVARLDPASVYRA